MRSGWRVFSFAVLTLMGNQLRADVTLRYETTVEDGPMPGLPPNVFPKDLAGTFVIQVKGDLGKITRGVWTVIVDRTKDQATIVNAVTKTYATERLSEILQGGTGLDVATVTGRTAVIQGIQAEEKRDRSISVWVSKFEEAGRVPAVAEMARFRRSYGPAMPFPMRSNGLDEINAMLAELLRRRTLILRVTIEITPLTKIHQQLLELSTRPLYVSAFKPPTGYSAVSLPQVLKPVAPEPPESVSVGNAGPTRPTLFDGVVSYTAEDGTRKRIDVGKRCTDL